MEYYENPVEELIVLDKRINCLNEKCVQIDLRTKSIEERKYNLYDQFVKLEDSRIKIPMNCELLFTQLIEIVEKHDELSTNWNKLVQQRNAINNNEEFMEKLILERNNSITNNNQRVKVEVMLIQCEQILARQKRTISQIEEALTVEEQIIAEIEKKFEELNIKHN